MDRLEERIVDSLMRLREATPDSERHMFVFPRTLMGLGSATDGTIETIVVDEAVLFLRPPE